MRRARRAGKRLMLEGIDKPDMESFGMTYRAASRPWVPGLLFLVVLLTGCGPSHPDFDRAEVRKAWLDLIEESALGPLRAAGSIPPESDESPITLSKYSWHDDQKVCVIFTDGNEPPQMAGAVELKMASGDGLTWEFVRCIVAAGKEKTLETLTYDEKVDDSSVDIAVRLDRYLSLQGVKRKKLIREQKIVLPAGFLDDVDPTETIGTLSAITSRLTGTSGCQRAKEFIRQRFEEIGLENIREHTFEVPVPNDRGSSLTVGSKSYTIHSMWPNLSRTSKTLSDGMAGHLVYAGSGRLAELDGLDIAGSVVLMDFNCRDGWLNLAQFGAIATIFIEPDQTTRKEAEDKFLQIPAAIHRYYIEKGVLAEMLGDILGEAVDEAGLSAALKSVNKRDKISGLVKADVLWENQTGTNIVGTIIGTDPELRRETLIIESFYDSISVVPAIAPGAESSCGIAALLEAAEAFKANPPKRTVRFLATSGHFQALAGMRHWCRDYWVWEQLMANAKVGMDDELFAPPRSIWPPKTEENAETAAEPEGAKKEEEAAGNEEQAEDEQKTETTSEPQWEPAKYPVIYATIDLSSQANQLGIFFKGHFYDIGEEANETVHRKKFSEIGTNTLAVAEDIRSAHDIDTAFVSCIDPIRGRKWRSYIPGSIALDNEVPLMYGKPEVGIVTVNDARALVDTPLDTVRGPDGSPRLNVDFAKEQARLATGVLWDLASRSYEIPEIKPSANELYVSLSEDAIISFLVGSPLPDALLAFEFNTQKALMGVRGTGMSMSNQQGRCLVVGTKQGNVAYTPFKIDRRDGSIEFVARKDVVGARVPSIQNEDWEATRTLDKAVPLFECSATLIFDLMDWLTYKTMGKAKVLDAARDSEPPKWATFIGQPSAMSSYSEPCGVVFVERGESNLKIIVESGPTSPKFTLIRSLSHEDKDMSQGVGFPASERENVILNTSYQAALDMWRLDDFRLERLRETGVRNERADYLHGVAGKRLVAARKALEEKDYVRFLNSAREAWAFEARAYPNVRGTADDVIKGLIFYLAVLLPFAVFGERLIFTFGDIRKRLLGISGLFVLIYLVLSQVHPGFKLATTAVIILAGFFMMVLGLVTIGILLGKFNTQMALMREKTGTWHRQDVNRSSAAGAAFMLGISNLRRRKIRTLLTCVTLVLLTFTVLSFTSFETSVAPNEIPTDYHSTYKGVLIRRRDWSSFEKYATTGLQDYFRPRGGTVVERRWLASQSTSEYKQLDIKRADKPELSFQSRGLLGFDPRETNLTRPQDHLTSGEWFDPASDVQKNDYPNVCILPKAMTDGDRGLKVAPDEVGKVSVTIDGQRLLVVGVIDDDTFKDLKDLDDEELTPVDYIEQAASALKAGTMDTYTVTDTGELETLPEQKPPDQYAHISPATIALVPNEFLQNHTEATLRSVAVGLLNLTEEDIITVLRDYVQRSRLILFAGLTDQVKLFSSRDALTAKGMKALFLPIAIASLIVFNTMLGSVYERLREIAVYTSCGLAPVHVASLFLAESCVFATMGAVVGYLLGQGVAKLVTETGKLSGINLNYSSVSAVYSILLVVAVVLLSTLYPARKAVQLSVPDESKKIRLPRPKGDVWEFDFPFTVSSVEALGLNAFIHDYFDSHNEDSGGVFCSDSVKLLSREAPSGITYVLDSIVWVEPMDMGISQKVVLETLPPTEEDRICTIKFTIHRLSGEVETWRRMNLGFLKAIRKQMLIWRLVDAEHKEQFDQQGKKLIKQSVEV